MTSHLGSIARKGSGTYLNSKQYAAFIADRKRVKALEKNLQQFLDFMRSLPPGWLGKTTADIGLLNDAYIEARRLGMKV